MKDFLFNLSSRIESIKGKVCNEEATKQTMILPLIQILGYDIFNPEEVMPEVSCDIANKGDRIDYIIYKDGVPAILMECKDWRQNPESHVNQLRKYFVASEARFSVITNGIRYLFFTDHDKANIMDEKPFYSLDMHSLSDDDVSFLSGFRKDSFNAMQMACNSRDMKYRDAILKNLRRELRNPSKGFVSMLTADVYKGKLTLPAYDKFSKMTKECVKLFFSEDLHEMEDGIKDYDKTEENPSKYTEEERKIVDLVSGWLADYETDEFKLYVRRMSDGYISFCYGNEWWNICRIKVRPKSNDKLCVKICRDGIYAKSDTRYVEGIGSLDSVRVEIENQCEDTKSRFFAYRESHNL